MNYPQEWEIRNNSLVRLLQFHTFIEAVRFVDALVPLAEELQHHPDIEIFSYNKVRITLSTHNARKITTKDITFANEINKMVDNNKKD